MFKRKKIGVIATIVVWAGFALPAQAAVELNQGTVADLDGLPGVGPALSRRILAARQEAPFKDWADFMVRVKGVKAKTAHRLSGAGLTVNGQPFAGGVVPAAPAPAR